MNPELKSTIDALVENLSASVESTDTLMDRAFSLAGTTAEKLEAGKYLRQAIAKRKRPDVDVRGILGEMAEVLNLSYIARTCFGKDRTWLYQRLNHSLVNGKQAVFSDSDLKKLSSSLAEISDKIHQISVQLSQ